MPHKNKNDHAAYQRKWRKATPERVLALRLAARQRQVNNRITVMLRGLDPIFKQKSATYRQKRRRQLKLEMIKAYGGACLCCKETNQEFLCLDHIEGGGNKHRAQVGNDLMPLAKREGFPNKYRLLCHNCNFSYGAYGYCPHQPKVAL